jgi:hypothetical protein
MDAMLHRASNLFDQLVSPINVRRTEVFILRLAIVAFLIHLFCIFLGNNVDYFKHFQHSYLKAIYTPFSFILFYEVLQLVIILPKSISEFIGKQFEVITLITLRSFFHDIADIDFLKSFSLTDTHLISLFYDLVASLIMLLCTIVYYKINASSKRTEIIDDIKRLIGIKKIVSLLMIGILLCLSFFSFSSWIIDTFVAFQTNQNYPNPNTVFYSEFFNVMIFVDVFLLLVSFLYHFSFFTVFRNASFIITTILLRMSLTSERPVNYLLVLVGFAFSIFSFYLITKGKALKL